MKQLKYLIFLFLITLIPACASSRNQKCTTKCKLTESEIKELCSKRNVALSDSLRQRLIADSKELHLTDEELQILKATGKVILCGKCGYLLNSLKYKQHKQQLNEQHVNTKTGFQPDSLRHRIILTYDNWGTNR